MPRPQTLLRFFVLFLAFLNVAYASVTTGTVKGTVTDSTGLAVPGVTITLASPSLMGTPQKATDAEGRYFFSELPPGTYEVLAEMSGFVPVRKTNVDVIIGRTAQVNIELTVADEAGATIVVEEDRQTIDTETGTRSTVLEADVLDRLPGGRSYQGAVQFTAGTTGGGNPNVGGAGSNENTYMLDGVNITDPVTGTFSLNFNFDATENLEVITSAFDPEYGVNLGGVINIATNEGSNTLEYSTQAYYTNGNWGPRIDSRTTAQGLELSPTDFDQQFQTFQLLTMVAGPVVRDKAWFILSHQHDRSLISSVGIELPRDYDGHYLFAKLTMQPVQDHRFRLIFQTDPTVIDNLDQSDRFTTPEAQSRQMQTGFVVSGQWDWYVSADAFFESKNTLQKSSLENYTVPCTHNQDLGYHPCAPTELENTIDLSTPARFGANNAYNTGSAGFYSFDDRWRWATDNKFSVVQLNALGTHDVKVGVGADYQAWNRTYGLNSNMYWVDLNLQAYDPDTLQNFYWFENSGAFTFQTGGFHWGAFAQDVWKPIDNLTFRYGTRYDRTIISDDVGNKVLDYGLFGPRFSVIWDPWGNAKTKFTGSVGRFNDTGRFGIASDLLQAGVGSKAFYGEVFNFYGNGSEQTVLYAPNENTTTILDGTIAPRSNEFTVGSERELFREIVAGAYFIGKYTRNLWSFDEVNQVWDEDGDAPLAYSDGNSVTYFRLRTPNLARRDYYRTDLFLRRDLSDRWFLYATYSYTSSRGSVQSAPSYWQQIPTQEEYWANGYLFTDIKHDVIALIGWDIPNDPWTTRVSATFAYESGFPVSRFYTNGWFQGGSVLYQTLGSYERTEPWWEMNVRVQQDIPVRKGDVLAILEVENIFNNRQGQYASLYSLNEWYINGRQNPLRVTLGGGYKF